MVVRTARRGLMAWPRSTQKDLALRRGGCVVAPGRTERGTSLRGRAPHPRSHRGGRAATDRNLHASPSWLSMCSFRIRSAGSRQSVVRVRTPMNCLGRSRTDQQGEPARIQRSREEATLPSMATKLI